MVYVFHDKDTCKEKETFTFTFTAGPSLKFCFDGPSSVPVATNRPFKRRRALSDVDGDGVSWRKKRRLRLQFITSRLSRPFSQPASNIVDRGSSKIALWGAKRRPLGKSVLRKAAIMNRVRMRMDAAKDFMRQEEERRSATLSLKELVLQKARCHEAPLPPSPLGLSNYDALDLEDEMEDEGYEDGLDRISSIYSDFNIMNPDTGDSKGDDFGYLDALDGISSRYLPDSPPPAPQMSSDIVEILREDMQGQSYFMSFAD